MTSLSRRLLLLVIAFALGLALFLPARLLESPIQSQLAPAQVALRGTVWSGRGMFRNAAASIPFAWQFEPAALLRLRAGWRVELLAPALSGAASIGSNFSNIEIRRADISADAGLLPQLHPAAAIVGLMQPAGRISLTVADALTAGYGSVPAVHGNAVLKAETFTLGSVAPQPLGSYQLQLAARDNIVDYRMIESAGLLKLDGGGSITLAGRRQFSYAGHATVDAALPERLRASLQSAGRQLPDGRLSIDYKAAW